MRQTNTKNQIWFERQEQLTRIGFTQDFLTSLDQCWHILPANLEKFREKSPLLTIETNDALISIVSPVKGNFMEFSPKAQNFPNKLTPDDVVLTLSDGPVVRAEPQQQEALFGGIALARHDLEMRQIQERIQRQAQAMEAARAPAAPQPAPRAGRNPFVVQHPGEPVRWMDDVDVPQANNAVRRGNR